MQNVPVTMQELDAVLSQRLTGNDARTAQRLPVFDAQDDEADAAMGATTAALIIKVLADERSTTAALELAHRMQAHLDAFADA